MPLPSLARSFFEQIRNAPDPVAFIRGLVNSTPPTYETDWLDFKEQPRLNAAQLADLNHGKWREIWVEALAGFANNQGGVLIWGIEARKDPATGIDAAVGEKPVANPEAVKSRLVELQRQATDPPLANVEIEAYELPTAPGSGFVVCFVPEGPYKPYRAEDGRRSQYAVRSGDNFTILSRSMLQSLFYPRSKAVFRAKATFTWSLLGRNEAARDTARLTCRMELANDGTATAKDAQVFVHTNIRDVRGDLQFHPYSGLWGLQRIPPDRAFYALHSMHPRRIIEMFYVEWLVEAQPRSTDHMVVPSCPPPQFVMFASCENQEPQVIEIVIDIDELIDKRHCVVEAKPAE